MLHTQDALGLRVRLFASFSSLVCVYNVITGHQLCGHMSNMYFSSYPTLYEVFLRDFLA